MRWPGAPCVWRREGLRSARTLIFRVLRWHDRSDILKGARQAYREMRTEQCHTAIFFPDFSPATAIRRKAFCPVLKKMTALGLQPSSSIRRVIKLRHKGEQRSSILLRKQEDFVSSLSLSGERMPRLCGGTTGGQRPLSLRPGGRGLMAGNGHGPSCPVGGGWQGGHGRLLNLFLLFLLSSLLLGYCPYISGTTISLLVRLTLLFLFLEGTNGE